MRFENLSGFQTLCICFLQKSRFTFNKPSISTLASDTKFTIYRVTSFVRCCLKKCFTEWTKQVHEKLDGEIISIDGKTIRGSRDKNQRPIHMISAWLGEQELVLGQMIVEEKTNEITTIPLLPELLDINGCIVTADAMSCQREIAKKITHGKGDYVLSLKENQPTLYEYAQTYFDDALKNPQWYPEIQSYETLDKGHGRIERRRYYLTSDLAGLANAKE